MKKITFFIALLTVSISFSQVYDQNYEGLTVGDPATDAGNQIEKGTGTVQLATASGNSTQILKAVHNSGQNDMFVRSGSFAVSEGQVYNVSFDIATTNTVHVVTIRYTIDDDFNTAQSNEPDTAATSTNGAQGGAPLGRIVTTANEFGTTSATFTVPADFNTARVQIYNYGAANSFELDNFLVALSSTASIEDLKQFNFSAYPNPAKNSVHISASKKIEKIEIFNLLGQKVITKETNDARVTMNVSSLKKGIYIIKAEIEGITGSHKFIKK